MKQMLKIERRRSEILEQLRDIRSLEKGTLKEQMLKVKHKDKEEPVLRGPYYVLARWANGKTQSRRVRGEELEHLKVDVANYQRLKLLVCEYEELTEQLGKHERDEGATAEVLKKKLK